MRPYERITLTLPALGRSRLVLILALGERKREALARMRGGEALPSALVAPVAGRSSGSWIGLLLGEGGLRSAVCGLRSGRFWWVWVLVFRAAGRVGWVLGGW